MGIIEEIFFDREFYKVFPLKVHVAYSQVTNLKKKKKKKKQQQMNGFSVKGSESTFSPSNDVDWLCLTLLYR